MSNSPLVQYTKISPNKTPSRNHVIDTITIHCVVGQLSAQKVCEMFANPARKASSNYVIGKDGEIGMSVEEKDRSWCSSSASNDNRAITIECASDTNPPYKINDKVYTSLIKLLVDICKRNNIPELRWRNNRNLIGKTELQNMTVHRWFANKACPGDYIFNRLSKIANDVNQQLKKTSFTVRVTEDMPVVIKMEPNWESETVERYVKPGVYTIVEESGNWGKLKSGLGWIPVWYTERL